MPTKAELLNLPYGETPANAGLTAAAYRKQYQEHGHRLNWWKNYPAPGGVPGRERNGRVYPDQYLPSSVRCRSYRTECQLYDAQFGLIEVGSTAIAVLPDEVWLRPYDRVSFPDVVWPHGEYLQRGENNEKLTFWPATEISKVMRADLSEVDASLYALSDDGKRIEWQAGGPDDGEFYIVEYLYEPRFEFQVQEQAVMQIGKDGAYLPQRGTLKLLMPDEMEN